MPWLLRLYLAMSSSNAFSSPSKVSTTSTTFLIAVLCSRSRGAHLRPSSLECCRAREAASLSSASFRSLEFFSRASSAMLPSRVRSTFWPVFSIFALFSASWMAICARSRPLLSRSSASSSSSLSSRGLRRRPKSQPRRGACCSAAGGAASAASSPAGASSCSSWISRTTVGCCAVARTAARLPRRNDAGPRLTARPAASAAMESRRAAATGACDVRTGGGTKEAGAGTGAR
mmetsp:Transcript_73285/g.202220  ORF Transcript_73285/g.202220 Transcript_73285/m.202220 type:complete len:232 (+) Transcript_73285:320-1015(+)